MTIHPNTRVSVSRRDAIAGLGAAGLGVLSTNAVRTSAQDATPGGMDGMPDMSAITLVPLGFGTPTEADGFVLSLTRITFPVGGGDLPHTHPGAAIVTIESGVMGMTPLVGNGVLIRSGSTDAEPVAHDLEITLNPGDAVFFDGVHGDVNRTIGDVPVVFLVTALYPADQPPITVLATPSS